MISSEQAYRIVMDHCAGFGSEEVALSASSGRYLAQPVWADRDLPPYDRATMDGIAIAWDSFDQGRRDFDVAGMARAGAARLELVDPEACIEIATGAVLPQGSDTVVRYEDLEATGEGFRILSKPVKRQNIHPMGSDAGRGTTLLRPGIRIGPEEIAIMASVGVSNPSVSAIPKVTLVSSGDELVEVDQQPLPHQIRKSNVYALRAALREFAIDTDLLHLPDQPGAIREMLDAAIRTSGVLMLSGGVSRGKFDFIPEALADLGVEKKFHRVAQRPGKPFWFGIHPERGCAVFSFPGNPVSTFLNYHLYFRDWLIRSWGGKVLSATAVLEGTVRHPGALTHFRPVRVRAEGGRLLAREVAMNGSGDFLCLSRAQAFAQLDSGRDQTDAGTAVPLILFKPLV